jgi:arginine-tRNA-protein transferase
MVAKGEDVERLAELAEPVFYRTRPFPCSYLPGRMESRILTVLSDDLADRGLFDILQRFGFRRSQRYLYRPACENCQACVPVRINAAEFSPNRTQRKQHRRNSDLKGSWHPAEASDALFDLFQRYEVSRHVESDMARMTAADLTVMIEESPVDTRLYCLSDNAGVIHAACLVDISDDGLSAVYSFFDPEDAKRSLGTELVVRLVEEARAMLRPYVYLGYWVEACRKMAYKAQFDHLERLTGTRWSSYP